MRRGRSKRAHRAALIAARAVAGILKIFFFTLFLRTRRWARVFAVSVALITILFFVYNRMKNKGLWPKVVPPAELVRALERVLAGQRGNEVLINHSKLKRAGFSGNPARVNELVEELLRNGFQDPRGRGVWVLDRVARNGNRKKFFAVLRRRGRRQERR
jgi:hypothetical protein